jgi:hypothetical protein
MCEFSFRLQAKKKCLLIYLHSHTNIHTFIYIYIHIERKKFIRTMTKLNIRDEKKNEEEKSADVNQFTKY